MRVRIFVFFLLFVFVFPVFWAVTTTVTTNSGSGSGSMVKGKPKVKFKEWQVGRSKKGTDTTSKEHKSFITSKEDVCYFTASAGYDGNQGDNVSPIDPSTVTWGVEKLSHGMTVEGELKNNWSGDSHPSKLAASTSFNVVGKLKVPKHIGTSKSHCSNYSGTDTPTNGRADTPMTFTIKFSAKTEDGQDILPVTLELKQNEIDEMRQEYMDMARQTTIRKEKVDGNVLRVPSRTEFELDPSEGYNNSHYSHMMGKTVLPKKHTSWTAAFKKHAKEKFKNTEAPDLEKTGAYRNPHHHYYHVPNGSSSPRGWHQFGLALDVRGKDIDINKDKKKGTLTDRLEMANAAKKYAGASWTVHTYSDGHVHAQWEWEGSNKEQASTSTSGQFSLPTAGTDTVACQKQTENSCNVLVSSSSEHYVTCPGSNCGDAYWSCDSEDYNEHRLRTCNWERLPLGQACNGTWRLCKYWPERIRGTNLHTQGPRCPTDPNNNRFCAERNTQTTPPNPTPPAAPLMYACGVHTAGSETGSNHSLQASCSETDSHGQSCTVSNYYACQSHTHQYPALITGACGHSYTSSASYNHRSETCPTDSNGNACTSGAYYVCQSHTHQYPVPTISCGRSACQETVSSTDEHRETCVSGHLYWSCKPSHVHLHKTRTCRRSGCGQSWLLCTSVKPNCLVNSAWKCRAE